MQAREAVDGLCFLQPQGDAPEAKIWRYLFLSSHYQIRHDFVHQHWGTGTRNPRVAANSQMSTTWTMTHLGVIEIDLAPIPRSDLQRPSGAQHPVWARPSDGRWRRTPLTTVTPRPAASLMSKRCVFRACLETSAVPSAAVQEAAPVTSPRVTQPLRSAPCAPPPVTSTAL